MFWAPRGDIGPESLRLEILSELSRVRQRDSRLQAEGKGAIHLYENLPNGFRAELPVDGEGIVRDAPGQWRRLVASKGDP